MKKSIVVFGLGQYGKSIALELTNAGADVLAVDNNKERVNELSDIVTCSVIADACDTESMQTLGISNMDAAVVAITQSLDAVLWQPSFAKMPEYLISLQRQKIQFIQRSYIKSVLIKL